MNRSHTLIMNALIAALYAALTIGLAPLSYGPVQVRLSEFLVLLAFYNRRWIPGLVLGCLLANLNSPFGLTDIVVGTTATFIALYLMRFAPNVWIASLFPVVSNGVLIGAELAYLAQIPAEDSLLGVMLYIGLGEFIAVSLIGVFIFHILLKNVTLRRYILCS
jgi:uncharacterized membrane protein